MPDARETGIHEAHTVPALKVPVSSREDRQTINTLLKYVWPCLWSMDLEQKHYCNSVGQRIVFGEGNGSALQHSRLGNSMDRGAW